MDREALKRAQAEWYRKLKETGFEDIEDGEDRLKSWSSQFARERTVAGFSEKQRYFELARAFLAWAEFETDAHREVWARHAEGESVRGIALELALDRNKVYAIIRVLRKRMQIDQKAKDNPPKRVLLHKGSA